MPKQMSEGERAWWLGQDLSSLTDLQRRMVIMRYGLGDDGTLHTFKEIGKAVDISGGQVWKLIDRIRVRLDRDTLVKAGTAMQLAVDLPLRGHLPLQDGGIALTAKGMFDCLEAVGVQTYNQLLDKSTRWLLGCGVGRGTVLRVEQALNSQGVYLRGTLPQDRKRLTSQRYTLTQS